MSQYALLDQADEDALHKARFLNVEEKAFKRITKHLLAPDSILIQTPQQTATPPPEDHAYVEEAFQKFNSEQEQLREDILLDFAAFEANLVRIQLLINSNAEERERYAVKRLEIQSTAQEIKENTIDLRSQLTDAQATLARRKEWDALTTKITNNRMLRSREDQQHAIENLKNEISELEQESREYATTWTERRQQFSKIIDEGMALRRQIRDEKEEVERREGMEDEEDGDGEDADGTSRRGNASSMGTPRPDINGGRTPIHIQDGGDPSQVDHIEGHLHPDPAAVKLSPVDVHSASDEMDTEANHTHPADHEVEMQDGVEDQVSTTGD